MGRPPDPARTPEERKGEREQTFWVRYMHEQGSLTLGALRAYRRDAGAFTNPLTAAEQEVKFFNEYFKIKYPYEKLDIIGIPDFAAGAMENAGAITFRERMLLADEKTASVGIRKSVAGVIAHELAHQWFGDLVTMKWWNGIWLNEAFATFMEIACCDAYRPDWKRWTTFSLERSAAFEVDALASTRSVEYPVEAPADCDGMFDVLTYQKGGALLRMLQQYLGADRFREGVRHYLALHSFGNTETSDLWDALEHTSGEPVRSASARHWSSIAVRSAPSAGRTRRAWH